MKTIEEKAKAYDEAIEKAKIFKEHLLEINEKDYADEMDYIFSELKESEDEKIKKALISAINNICNGDEGLVTFNGFSKEQILTWLEKQGEIDKISYDIAEKEKHDFVNGQFIECRKSFNEFKEDNSYWLEYVGNDTYIGRSDNILNKKFHITPRQLYRLFSQQHCPKEDNANEETNAPTGYGKYVDECLNEAAKHFFSEGEDTYSVADLFYAGVRCGKSWIEKQKPVKMIQWTGDNLKEVIDFTGVYKEGFEKWFHNSFAEYENYVRNHGYIFKIFNEDGSHYEVPVGAWIVKTPDGYNVASKTVFKHNPAWSEECKKAFSDICENCCGRTVELVKKIMQPKQEWSEEDEEFLSEIISDIKFAQDKYPDSQMNQIIFDEEVTWLKSLKDRYNWKPSDEQIEALESATENCAYSEYQDCLKELIAELKKLKE